MQYGDLLTFGGSGLDRAAELRPKADEIWSAGQGQVILFWRGKPLLNQGQTVRLPLDHSVLALADDRPIYLGRDEGVHVFAADISKWKPESIDGQVGQFVDKSLQTHPDFPEEWAFEELRQAMTRLTARDAELIASAKAILEWHRSHRFCSKCGVKSELAMGGWERQCPACDAKHFPRTDPVVIMLITRGNSVLIGRSPFWPEGMYSLLAGFVEPGETIEAAVRREIFEESGISVGDVHYMACQPWPFPNSLMIGCRGEALSDEIVIDPSEIEDAIWVTREEMALAFTGEHPKIKPARNGSIAHFLLQLWLADKIE
mgnify:FL=1